MSQTRRKGIEILRDEITSIIAVVRNHSDAVTRRLEKVREMTTKYCSGTKAPLGSAPAPAPLTSASSLASSAPSLSSASNLAPSLAPTFAPSGALNTIPELNENTESENNSVNASAATTVAPVAPSLRQKSKGPVNWSTFRTKVGEGTDLKTGQQSTLDRISTLWKQAKEGKPVAEIEKYLRNELKINAAVAAQKAPELEMIARSYANRSASTIRKPGSSARVTRRLPSVGGVTSAAPAAAAAAAPRSKKPKVEAPQENDAAFWERMNREAMQNYENKTKRALALPEQRRRVQEEAALQATPLKNRQVPLASIPTLVPQPTVRTANQAALNSALGGKLNEELDL